MHSIAFMLLLLLADSAFSQELQGFRLSDSNRVVREPFFVPSMSPSLDFTAQRFYGSQLSLTDHAVIDNGFLGAYQDSWKRSFLLGATTYTAHKAQPSPWMARKETFFQTIQAALGIAELAGVAYLGYKAIKKEPITKKK